MFKHRSVKGVCFEEASRTSFSLLFVIPLKVLQKERTEQKERPPLVFFHFEEPLLPFEEPSPSGSKNSKGQVALRSSSKQGKRKRKGVTPLKV